MKRNHGPQFNRQSVWKRSDPTVVDRPMSIVGLNKTISAPKNKDYSIDSYQQQIVSHKICDRFSVHTTV